MFKPIVNPSFVNLRTLSYASRSRFLQELKESDAMCQDNLKSGKYLIYNKGKPLLTAGGDKGMMPVWLKSSSNLIQEGGNLDQSVLLGVDESGVPEFALPVDLDKAAGGSIEAELGGRFIDLRAGLFLVGGADASLLSRGWSLLNWKRNQNFCSKCGSPVVVSVSASKSTCLSCSIVNYPSSSPVSIVSVSDPFADKLLLVRLPKYPPGMFSCIAGFVDVGESVEECARREVAEEAGIEVDKVSVVDSQHWPFPTGSLMIGCAAEIQHQQEPQPCPTELEDARWFTRKQVSEAVQRIDEKPSLRMLKDNDPNEIFVPPKGAIAYTLITKWLGRS